MIIRHGNPDADRSQIRECIVELQDFERTLDPRMPAGDDIADAYFAEMLRKVDAHDGRILVAEDGDKLAGYVAVLSKVRSEDLDDGDLEYALIDDIVVRESFRGGGVGKMLMEAAEQFVIESGARWLRLSVLASNQAARKLYQSRGFRELYIDFEKAL